jgi:hypothetical protein
MGCVMCNGCGKSIVDDQAQWDDNTPYCQECWELKDGPWSTALNILKDKLVRILLRAFEAAPEPMKPYDAKTYVDVLLPTLAEEQRAANEWKQEVIERLVLNFILTKEHENNPRKALDDLLVWEQKCALDPAISEEVNKLLHKARLEEAKWWAKPHTRGCDKVTPECRWMHTRIAELSAGGEKDGK